MEHINKLVARYQNKGLLIDTNLLLLYFIGAYDPDRIPKFKRTMSFTVEEFWLLNGFLDVFDKLVTTPNVLTEVSNLSGQLAENLRAPFYRDFASRIPLLEEHYVPSVGASSLAHFNRFGLTDSGIVELAKDKYLVLTDDLNLVGYLQNRGIDVINFNHIRPLAWDT
jgi:rRNA-processing protein FCF1